jgi:hypothetical protein
VNRAIHPRPGPIRAKATAIRHSGRVPSEVTWQVPAMNMKKIAFSPGFSVASFRYETNAMPFAFLVG